MINHAELAGLEFEYFRFTPSIAQLILDSALIYLRMNARIVICGAISQYNNVKANNLHAIGTVGRLYYDANNKDYDADNRHYNVDKKVTMEGHDGNNSRR